MVTNVQEALSDNYEERVTKEEQLTVMNRLRYIGLVTVGMVTGWAATGYTVIEMTNAGRNLHGF